MLENIYKVVYFGATFILRVLKIKIFISELARLNIQVKCTFSMPVRISATALGMSISSQKLNHICLLGCDISIEGVDSCPFILF